MTSDDNNNNNNRMATTRVSQSQVSGLKIWHVIRIVAIFSPSVQRLLECLKLTHDLFLKWKIFPTDYSLVIHYFFLWRCDPTGAMASSFLRFLDHTQRRITVGRTPLDEWSARRRDLYLTTHNTHNKHPCHRWDSNPQSQQASGRRPTP